MACLDERLAIRLWRTLRHQDYEVRESATPELTTAGIFFRLEVQLKFISNHIPDIVVLVVRDVGEGVGRHLLAGVLSIIMELRHLGRLRLADRGGVTDNLATVLMDLPAIC
jgi:hypothetical protein